MGMIYALMARFIILALNLVAGFSCNLVTQVPKDLLTKLRVLNLVDLF